MIEITVTMIPKGRRANARVMGRMYIHNDKSGTKQRGNYVVRMFARNRLTPFKQTTVMDFPRLRAGVWKLILAALARAYA